MKKLPSVALEDVRAVYDGAEGALWELLMGQQIHIGGLQATLDLAQRAGIGPGQRGVDLCCCNGADMRALVRLCGVESMLGVDAAHTVVERGRARCEEEGLDDRVQLILADACSSGLPTAAADFVWSEDAWCYVIDKPKLIAEATRIVKPGGTIAFTDWVEGSAGLGDAEAERLMRFMKFPSLQDIQGYAQLLEKNGCEVRTAEDTGRFVPHIHLYRQMIDMQLTYDAMKILEFDTALVGAIAGEMEFLTGLAEAGKLVQARFIARRQES